jgi:hypothetical protein
MRKAHGQDCTGRGYDPDSLATLNADGRTLDLTVINRSEDQDLSAAIRVSGYKVAAGDPVRVFEMNGKDKVAANPSAALKTSNIQEKVIRVELQNSPASKQDTTKKGHDWQLQ